MAGERFRSIASLLRESGAATRDSRALVAREEPALPAPPGEEGAQAIVACHGDIALARLAVFEAYERARRRLLERLARDVLGRELALAPVDLGALAERVVAEFAQEEPVALVVSPADAPRLQAGLPVRVDASLCAGDVVVVVRDGSIDARFALRFERCISWAAT